MPRASGDEIKGTDRLSPRGLLSRHPRPGLLAKPRPLAYRTTPFGHLQVWGYPAVYVAVDLKPGPIPRPLRGMAEPPELLPLLCALENYLTDPSASLPSPPGHLGTPYQQKVWSAIRQIPVGQRRTYGELAAQLASHPRAVAGACGANPFPLLTPCHRVVSARGLGGFLQGALPASLAIKRWLLDHEAPCHSVRG